MARSLRSEHKRLRMVLITRIEDYDPWGLNKRWRDPHQAYPDCSCGCRFFVPLDGALGGDWGVCSNPESHRAGLLTFEHQGCQKFTEDRRRGLP